MPIWSNSKADILYYDCESDNNEPCEVRIDENIIALSYDTEDGPVVHKGKNNGDGHFEIKSPEVNGQASLHMFKNSKILERFWIENGFKGMWRITLA